MDITILSILGLIIAVVLLTVIVKYLNKKNIINTNELEVISRVLNIGTEILDELNLKNEDKILEISNIIQKSITYINNSITTNTESEKQSFAVEYTIKLCEDAGIFVTDARKELINKLVGLAISKI